MFKVVLLGEAGVGKSSIFLRLKENVFGESLQPTVGIESCSKVVKIDGQSITVSIKLLLLCTCISRNTSTYLMIVQQASNFTRPTYTCIFPDNFLYLFKKFSIWDTAGAERFKTITRNYYRNTHAVLLVYSCDDPSSLHYLAQWAEDCSQYAPNGKSLSPPRSSYYPIVSHSSIDIETGSFFNVAMNHLRNPFEEQL